jgi:hypothetical protein
MLRTLVFGLKVFPQVVFATRAAKLAAWEFAFEVPLDFPLPVNLSMSVKVRFEAKSFVTE